MKTTIFDNPNAYEFNTWTGLWEVKEDKSSAYTRKDTLFVPKNSRNTSQFIMFDDMDLLIGSRKPHELHSALTFYGTRHFDEQEKVQPKTAAQLEAEAQQKKAAEEKDLKMRNPAAVKAELDRCVVGQDEAKRALSIAFAETYKGKGLDSAYQRTNVIIVGPTGCGKTKLLESLASLYDIPMEIIKVGSMVQEGIVGQRMSQVLQNLKKKMDKKEGKSAVYNPFGFFGMGQEQTPSELSAIIYIDEIDKICTTRNGGNVFGQAIQDQLIGLMDSGISEGINTNNILFVAGGAFEGLEGLASGQTRRTIGFDYAAESQVAGRQKITDANLINYGLKRELSARFPMRTILHPLTEEHMIRIMTESEGSVLKTTADFYKKTDDVTLEITTDAAVYMARHAYARQTGARALRGVLEDVLESYKFNIAQYRGQTIQIGINEARRALEQAA
jgi:ATP-dependent Clp protease ATP-binding subunit ClpX